MDGFPGKPTRHGQTTMSENNPSNQRKEMLDKMATGPGMAQREGGPTMEREHNMATRPGSEKTQTSKQAELNLNVRGSVLDKTLNVNVEIVGEDRITMMELLNAVKHTCGTVLGCRFKGKNKYELTMSNAKGKERLIDGFKIKNTQIMAKEVARNEMVVSFLNLPTYITDLQILGKLDMWGVEATSPVKRRRWANTDIFDGTRFLRVKFNEYVASLPYSTKFETLEGTEHFRVIHDNQVKVCRLCVQPGHILRDCPEFKCHKCGQNGHYARECSENNVNCEGCTKRKDRCVCQHQDDGNDGTTPQADMEVGEEGEEAEEEAEEEDEEEEEDNVIDNELACGQRQITTQAAVQDEKEEESGSSLDSVPLQPFLTEHAGPVTGPQESTLGQMAPPPAGEQLSRDGSQGHIHIQSERESSSHDQMGGESGSQTHRRGRSQSNSQMRNRSRLQSQARGEEAPSRDRSRSNCRGSSRSGQHEVKGSQAACPGLQHNNGEGGGLQHTVLEDRPGNGKGQKQVVSDSVSEGTTESDLNSSAENRRKFSKHKEEKVKGAGGRRERK